MNTSYNIFLFLFALAMGISSAWGQDCAKIKREAEFLARDKKSAQEAHQGLVVEFVQKETLADQYQLTLPAEVGEALRTLSPDDITYKDERGTCHEDGITWGTIKDLREYKRDSIEYLNSQLIRKISALQGLIEAYESQMGISSPTTPAPSPQIVRESPTGALMQEARQVVSGGKAFLYCILDPKRVDMRIADRADFAGLYDFATLDFEAQQEDKKLIFAMNAGMFHADKRAVGLLVQQGRRVAPLNLRKGKGNFYMYPNGVFYINANGQADIMKSTTFAKMVKEGRIDQRTLRLATQSGPIMLSNSNINPQFGTNSPNLHIRNAVGVMEDGRVMFVISRQRVTFHELSSFMRAKGCKEALYLDGVVSRMYLPAADHIQDLYDSSGLGPILYIVD